MGGASEVPPAPAGDPDNQFLCLTICGYRKPGLSEEDYRHHMTKVMAPMTKDLMVKYGVKRWTMVCLCLSSVDRLFLELVFVLPFFSNALNVSFIRTLKLEG
jgi:hypothetical protein